MQRKSAAKFLFLLAAVSFSFGSIPSAHAQPLQANTLPRLAELFLGTWAGKGVTPDGAKFKSKLSFSWALDKNFVEVRNEIEVAGKRELFALTVYGWQPVLNQLVFWSFDKDGTINEGAAEIEGQSLKHEWRSFRKGGAISSQRSLLTRDGPKQLTFSILDGSNEVISSIKYKRKS